MSGFVNFSTPGSETPPKAQPTILVVDDEPALLKLMVFQLEMLGWKVHAAADGAEAIRIAESLNCRLHLLLTDIQMPDIRGDVLIRRVRSLCPHVDALAMTGALPEGTWALPNVPYLRKPFTVDALATAIGQIMSSRL